MRVPDGQPWSTQVIEPEQESSFKPANPPWESEFSLIVLTDAKGFDFSDAQRFVRSLHKHPNGSKGDQSVGHSWLLLTSPDQWIEGGHTGEFGIDTDQYYQGVFQLTVNGDPNPIRYLQTRMPDGEFQIGPGSHQPTFAARFELTKEQHASVLSYINNYDYGEFSLTERQCTDFASGALQAVGVNVANRLTITPPAQIKIGFDEITLWTDPKYGTLTLGFPDILENEMRRLVENKIASDATTWYLAN